MILILFLCLKLSLLHLCVSDNAYQCIEDNSSNNPEIFLIEDKSFAHRDQLNTFFYTLCGDYYDIKFVTLDESEKHDNVIYFAVPDYYDGKPLDKFVYAGNISKIDDAVCIKTGKQGPEFDCNEIANLVSKSILDLNDGHLYDFVQKMSIRESEDGKSCEPFYSKTSDLTTVLLCLRGNKKIVNIQPLQLIQVADWDCSNYFNKNSLLAVLAPEPFNLPVEYSVPTIFYETPYLFSEYKTTFPNSMNLVPWQLLKYGFLTFIQTMGWQRVAIVSDDSEYSLEFEDELIALFNIEKIIYTVIRCEDANFEIDKIVQELSGVPANIVIANVEEENAHYLFQHADRRITWLVRDMIRTKHDKYLPNGFSFSLRIDAQTKGCDVEDNILISLNSIAQTYKNIAKEDNKGNKQEFYRRFATITKNVTPRITEATVVVYKLNDLEEISTMSVNTTGANLINFKRPSFIPPDGTARCLASSYDYHKICEDQLVVLLMLIVMLFVLTLLLITCYFDKTSPYNDIRYQNF